MVVYTLEQRCDLQKAPILTNKEIIFSDEAQFDLGKIVAFGAYKTHTYTLKS